MNALVILFSTAISAQALPQKIQDVLVVSCVEITHAETNTNGIYMVQCTTPTGRQAEYQFRIGKDGYLYIHTSGR